MKLMFPGLLFLFKKRSFACTEEYKGVLDTLVKKFFNKTRKHRELEPHS